MFLVDYPFLSIVWTMLVIFAWVIWFWLLIRIFADIFRRHDLSGFPKVLWMIFIIILPFIGVFIYLIMNAGEMVDRDAAQVAQAQRQFDSYVQSVAGSGGAAAEIDKAKGLLDSGAITQAEFNALKQKALT